MLSKWPVLIVLVTSASCLAQRGAFPDQHPFPGNGEDGFPSEEFPGNRLGGTHRDPPPNPRYDEMPVEHAGVPRGLAVFPVPLKGSDHELQFNVSWMPPLGSPAREYSLEVMSDTQTADCDMPVCYEYNIPGEATWWTVPAMATSVAGGCAVLPGCAYTLRLLAHPWDGHTAAHLRLQLDECVAGVCSCAHSPRLPGPRVSASIVSVQGEIFVNISWSLPPPQYPLRLPRGLAKRSYFVSVGKQMVSDAHPAPWFANTITREVDTDGPVLAGDPTRWLLLPVTDRPERVSQTRSIVLDVKLLARVSLLDDRGCVGPAGNATAYDPAEARKATFMTYALWASLGGACVLATLLAAAVGARGVKRLLRALRPAPAPTPRRRPAWLPLRFRTNAENVPRVAHMEQSPLYVHKVFEEEEVPNDGWEVARSRVHLGALIGSGAFGQVHLAQLDMPGGETMTVAAKMLSEVATEEEQRDFLREIEMLKHVGRHRHVIQLVACCTQRAPLALLEHAPRGDLLTLLRAARGRGREDCGRMDSGVVEGRPSEADTEYTNLSDSDPALTLATGKSSSETAQPRTKDHYVAEPALHLDSSTMRDYALQVALGMRHLEQRGITHRDLAARNILVDATGTLKVADFGLSRSGVYVHTRARPVPLRWLAPEAILHSQYCAKSDVWAFAVLLWEIATLGGFPYAELSNHQVPAFLAGGSRLPKPARASPRLYQLMATCWAEDPDDRPMFAQIVNKLQAQQQLYVDLDGVFPPDEQDFSMSEFSAASVSEP